MHDVSAVLSQSPHPEGWLYVVDALDKPTLTAGAGDGKALAVDEEDVDSAGGEGAITKVTEELEARDAERVFCRFGRCCRSDDALRDNGGGLNIVGTASNWLRRARRCSFSAFNASFSSE